MTQAYVGTTALGGASLTMVMGEVYAKRIPVPAQSLLALVGAFVGESVANVPGMGVCVLADNAGSPGICLMPGVSNGNAMLITATERAMEYPAGVWSESARFLWIGVYMTDPGDLTLSMNMGTGTDVTLASASDIAARVVTADDYCLYASIFTGINFARQVNQPLGTLLQDPNSQFAYSNPVSVPVTSFVPGVEFGTRSLGASGLCSPSFMLNVDVAGAPGPAFYHYVSGTGYEIDPTPRLMTIPVMQEIPANDYWFSMLMADGLGAAQLLYEAGSGVEIQGTNVAFNQFLPEPGTTGTLIVATPQAFSFPTILAPLGVGGYFGMRRSLSRRR